MKPHPFIFLFILLTAFIARCQEKDKTDTTLIKQNVSYLRSYWIDTKGVLTAPVHWNAGKYIAASAVIVGTAALITQDVQIQKFFKRNETTFIDKTSFYFFSPLGTGFYSIPALGIFYGCGLIWKKDKAKETALNGLKSYVITAVFTQILKQVTHRHRPYQTDPSDPLIWDGPFSLNILHNSFPSGHSSAIFSIATVIAYEYHQTVWVPIVCYTVAGFTALYRLAVNDHWASDVLFGSALGYAIGSLVYHHRANKTFEIVPVSSSGIGAALVFHL